MSTIRGTTKLIAHLGYPTESFKAPMIYNPYFQKHGIDAVVVPMGCKADDYAAFLPLVFKLSNIHGALITMPHKVTTVAMLDVPSTTVQVAGACNAVRLGSDGLLIGDMFDGEGFVRGVRRKGRALAGARVLVVGCGGVGLNIVQGARLAGAKTIIACDLLDNKLQMAGHFGATHIINGKRDDVIKKVMEITGLGVDYAFDAIGSEATVVQIVDALAPAGHAVIVGIPSFTTRAPMSPHLMVYGEKTLSGSYYGSVRPAVDFGILADLSMEKRLNLDDLISRTYKFEEINEGFKIMMNGQVARGVITFN